MAPTPMIAPWPDISRGTSTASSRACRGSWIVMVVHRQEILDGELGLAAAPGHEVLVRADEFPEAEGVGGLHRRDDERALPRVRLLDIDRDPEVDARHGGRRPEMPLPSRSSTKLALSDGHVRQGADDRVGDEVREAHLLLRDPCQLLVEQAAVDVEELGGHGVHARRGRDRQARDHVLDNPGSRAAKGRRRLGGRSRARCGWWSSGSRRRAGSAVGGPRVGTRGGARRSVARPAAAAPRCRPRAHRARCRCRWGGRLTSVWTGCPLEATGRGVSSVKRARQVGSTDAGSTRNCWYFSSASQAFCPSVACRAERLSGGTCSLTAAILLARLSWRPDHGWAGPGRVRTLLPPPAERLVGARRAPMTTAGHRRAAPPTVHRGAVNPFASPAPPRVRRHAEGAGRPCGCSTPEHRASTDTHSPAGSGTRGTTSTPSSGETRVPKRGGLRPRPASARPLPAAGWLPRGDRRRLLPGRRTARAPQMGSRPAGITAPRLIQTTDVLSRAIATSETAPPVLVSMSATGYYGSRGDEILRREKHSGIGLPRRALPGLGGRDRAGARPRCAGRLRPHGHGARFRRRCAENAAPPVQPGPRGPARYRAAMDELDRARGCRLGTRRARDEHRARRLGQPRLADPGAQRHLHRGPRGVGRSAGAARRAPGRSRRGSG